MYAAGVGVVVIKQRDELLVRARDKHGTVAGEGQVRFDIVIAHIGEVVVGHVEHAVDADAIAALGVVAAGVIFLIHSGDEVVYLLGGRVVSVDMDGRRLVREVEYHLVFIVGRIVGLLVLAYADGHVRGRLRGFGRGFGSRLRLLGRFGRGLLARLHAGGWQFNLLELFYLFASAER